MIAAALALFAAIHGLHMYYEDLGKGPPLVLIHGGGSTLPEAALRALKKPMLVMAGDADVVTVETEDDRIVPRPT